MAPNKNEAARLRRVLLQIDRVLDALHNGAGQLYPAGLKSYREPLQQLISQAEKLQKRIQADLPKKASSPQQLDIEDFDEGPEEAA